MKAELYYLTIPMQCSFDHAESKRNIAETVILKINYQNHVGIGECVPRKYVTGETIESVLLAVQSLNLDTIIKKIDFSSLASAISTLKQLVIFSEDDFLPLNAICLVEMTLLDLIGKYFNVSLREIIEKYLLNAELRNDDDVLEYKTTQVMDLSLTPEEFLGKRAPFHYIKIKVGHCVSENVQRVRIVREALGDDISISVDANMAWELNEALEMAKMLHPFNISYYEEPLKKGDYNGYNILRKKARIKILLDESLCHFSNAYEAIKKEACDAFNIRISKCGGLINALRLINFAYKNRIHFQLGAQVAEAGPLIAAGRHLVAAINQANYFSYEAGQPDRFFGKDYIVDPMPLVDRSTNLAKRICGAGLGVNLNHSVKQFLTKTSLWENGAWL